MMILKKFSLITTMAMLLGCVLCNSCSAMSSDDEADDELLNYVKNYKSNQPPKQNIPMTSDGSSDQQNFDFDFQENEVFKKWMQEYSEQKNNKIEEAKKLKTTCENHLKEIERILVDKLGNIAVPDLGNKTDSFIKGNLNKFIEYIEKDAVTKVKDFDTFTQDDKNIRIQFYKAYAKKVEAALETADIAYKQQNNNGENYHTYRSFAKSTFKEKNAKIIVNKFFKILDNHLEIKSKYDLCVAAINQCSKIINKDSQVKYDEIEYVKQENNSKDFMKTFIQQLKHVNLNSFFSNESGTQNKIRKDVIGACIFFIKYQSINNLYNAELARQKQLNGQ